jgi:hypothetical protein
MIYLPMVKLDSEEPALMPIVGIFTNIERGRVNEF